MSNGNNETVPIAPAMAATNTHILNLRKFRTENEISFNLWVMQFETQLQELWNFISRIIPVWSLFWSLRVYASLRSLSILLEK